MSKEISLTNNQVEGIANAITAMSNDKEVKMDPLTMFALAEILGKLENTVKSIAKVKQQVQQKYANSDGKILPNTQENTDALKELDTLAAVESKFEIEPITKDQLQGIEGFNNIIGIKCLLPVVSKDTD